MFLYHGTTKMRAEKIFADRAIKCNIPRHYTKGKNTEQGYVYLALEPTYSMHYANCCNLEDKSSGIVIFKIEMEDESLEPDYDEIRVIPVPEHIRNKYISDLDFSMNELKCCRIRRDIHLDDKVSYATLSIDEDINTLIGKTTLNLSDTIQGYSNEQKKFLKDINWISCVNFATTRKTGNA